MGSIETVEKSSNRQQSLRIIALSCLAAVPAIQLVIVALSIADHNICFGSEGGWQEPRDLFHLAPGALQLLASWGALPYLAIYAVPVLPALLYTRLKMKHAPRLVTVLSVGYLLIATIPFMDRSTWHDCDRKGLNMFDLFPPILSSLNTACFLLVAITVIAFKKTDDHSS